MSAKQLKDQQHLIKNCLQLLDKCVSQKSFVFGAVGFGCYQSFPLTVVVYCYLGSSLTVPLYLRPIKNLRVLISAK